MCTHRFVFPEESPENYNPDGKTITGICKCGATQKAYGVKWMVRRAEHFHAQDPKGYGSQFDFIDKSYEMW